MRRDVDRVGRCAAALQCIAEEFREFAAHDRGVREGELNRFAGLLDHMAASLMVPPPFTSAEIIRLPAPSERAEAAAPGH